jgi:hypothetical protein
LCQSQRLLLENWKGMSCQMLIRLQEDCLAGVETLLSEIHKLIMLIWNKEELPHHWKESVVLSVHKKDDNTDCSNYWGMSLLLTSYKIVPNILLSRLIPYADEIIGVTILDSVIIGHICQTLEA